MDGDQKFWFGFWAILGSVLATVVITFTAAGMYTNSRIAEAIKNGADPMRAACGFNISPAQYCYVIAK
jgi:hypothetical protein